MTGLSALVRQHAAGGRVQLPDHHGAQPLSLWPEAVPPAGDLLHAGGHPLCVQPLLVLSFRYGGIKLYAPRTRHDNEQKYAAHEVSRMWAVPGPRAEIPSRAVRDGTWHFCWQKTGRFPTAGNRPLSCPAPRFSRCSVETLCFSGEIWYTLS